MFAVASFLHGFRERTALRELPIVAVAALVTVACAAASAIYGGVVVVALLITLVGTLSVYAAFADRPALLIGLLVSASAVQRAIAAELQASLGLWLDDIALVGIAIFVARMVMRRAAAKPAVLWVVAGALVLLVVAVSRAPEIGLGISQARQVLVPALLLAFGSVLSHEQVRKIAPFVVVVIAIGAVYGLVEQLGWRPIDPIGVLELNNYSHSGSRQGLPNSYYYYVGESNDYLLRSGGLILNPPSFGMLAAAGILWARMTGNTSPLLRWLAIIAFSAAVVASFGRGGMVIAVAALLQPFLSRKLGAWAFGIVGVALAIVAYGEWAGAGQSVRHIDGFTGGFAYAIANPLGGGFGTAGNALSQVGLENESGANESLAAIFLAAFGWPAIVALAVLLFRGIRRGSTIAGTALTAAILVCLVSETSSGLDATGPLWILAGSALIPAAAANSLTASGTYLASRREPRRTL